MLETRRVSPDELRTFFRPRSIALVGATDNSRWSTSTYGNLKTFGFPGPIYLVNPNREIVHGERALASLSRLPEPADLAFVMVSTQRVFSVVREAADVGITKLVVLTSGFSEMGAEGLALERELLTFASEHGMTLLGPNGNGFVNVADQIAPYGLPIVPPMIPGPVGVVLQSGALASAVMTFAQAHAIGLSLLISMGNETMLSATDVVDYLIEDDATRVIALFLECIRHPEELRRVAEKARERQKPIVALKIGRSDASSRTALAHTGALVGDDAVNDAALRQLGILRVGSLEDLLITAGLAGYTGPLPGRRMGVVTPSGGACDILSDLAADEHIDLPEFAPQTVERLKEVVPPFSTIHNPLDVTGYVVVDRTLQQRALEVVIDDPSFDFVLCLTDLTRAEPAPAVLGQVREQYDQLAEIIRAATRPVVVMTNTCTDVTPFGRSLVERTGLHFLGGMEHGIRALGRLLWWSEFIRSPNSPAIAAPDAVPVETRWPRRGVWSEAQARELLAAAGIPVVPGVLAATAEEAVAAARTLGTPVALKVQSAALPHKSDVGGVALGLEGDDVVRAAYEAMLVRVGAARPDAEIEGVLVSPMRSAGTELLVGVVRDALWGQVLTLGLGGIWTEALRDTAVRVLPVRRSEIAAMLSELRGAAVLNGGRGRPAADREALSEVIERVSQLGQSLGDALDTLEINPLLVGPSGIEALDVLVTWR